MTAPVLASPVRDQYEEYPYPPRDPERELERLWTTLIGQVGAACHALWAGTRRPGPGFRALDAGCGTGDNTIFLAEQLRACGGTVVGVDISTASLAIAGARARARALENVEFVHASLEDLPSLGLGTFDYAVSAGVLHHLPSPAEGLRAIRSVLTPGGGIGLMVYGQYGRTGIYLLQELFRELAPETLPASERVRIVRKTLPKLRPDHWGVLGNASWQGEVALHGDAGLFDVFLHSTDRAYTVPQVYDWLAEAGLELVRFAVAPLYNPALYAAGIRIEGLDGRARHTLAELLSGRMQKHSFYAAPVGETRAAAPAADDEAAIPCWLSFDADGVIAGQVAGRPELALDYEGLQLRMPLDPFTRLLLKQVDGRTNVGEILARQETRFPKIPRAQQRAKWLEIHDALSQFNVLGVMAPGWAV